MDAAAGVSIGLSMLALVASLGAVIYARQSATEAKRANDLEAARDRAAQRPRLHFEITGDMDEPVLVVLNKGAIPIKSLLVEIVDAEDEISFAVRGQATETMYHFADVRPAIPESAEMTLGSEPHAAEVTFVCLAETDDDQWRFQVVVKAPYDIAFSVY